MDPFTQFLTEPDMSTLALIVEGSACAWGKLAVLHGSETINDVIRAVISFANSHLSMSASNQLLLFAFANKIKRRLLYNSQRGAAADASTAMLNALRDTLRDSANSDDYQMGSPLAAVLSHAMCHLKRTDGLTHANDELVTTSSSSGRVVIVAMTTDFGTEHGPLMNLFFSAAKHNVCVDVVSLVEPSPLLQQAADITGGIFLRVQQPSKLLSNIMKDDKDLTYSACICADELKAARGGIYESVLKAALGQLRDDTEMKFKTLKMLGAS